MTADATFLTRQVELAIAAGEAQRSKLMQDALEVPGLTSVKVRHFLNTLCDWPGCSYLEVGTHRGATLVSAAYGNPGYYAGVDNWSEFADEGQARTDCYYTLGKLAGQCCVAMTEADCWDLAARLPDEMFQVFFYDGSHDLESQRAALRAFDHALRKPCVLVVDDWRQRQVRAGTELGIQDMQYRIVQEWKLRSERNKNPAGWWCGVYVAVLDR